VVKCADCVYLIRETLNSADKRCYWCEDVDDKDKYCGLYYPTALAVDHENCYVKFSLVK